jgi:hypothetical protein
MTITTSTGTILRPVGTFCEAPDGYNGETHSGQLLADRSGTFWVRGVNSRGNHYLFPVTDQWAAVHCNSVGIAPTTRGVA